MAPGPVPGRAPSCALTTRSSSRDNNDWFGWSHRILLPNAFMLGGCFLVVCDLVSRSILAPAELPIGIITAMVGGPFFLWTLFRSNSSGELL